MELNYVGNGKIYFNEKEYICDLYLNEDEGGIAIDISIEEALASIVDLPLNIDFLVGELSTGFKFSLIYCKRNRTKNSISEGRSIYSYYCRYLLKGIGKKHDRIITLNKVNFQMLNTMAWGNISAYKISDDFKLSNSKDIKKKFIRMINLKSSIG